jgi:hypothetical protein
MRILSVQRAAFLAALLGCSLAAGAPSFAQSAQRVSLRAPSCWTRYDRP